MSHEPPYFGAISNQATAKIDATSLERQERLEAIHRDTQGSLEGTYTEQAEKCCTVYNIQSMKWFNCRVGAEFACSGHLLLTSHGETGLKALQICEHTDKEGFWSQIYVACF